MHPSNTTDLARAVAVEMLSDPLVQAQAASLPVSYGAAGAPDRRDWIFPLLIGAALVGGTALIVALWMARK